MSFISGYIWGVVTCMILNAVGYVIVLYLQAKEELRRQRLNEEWKMRQRRGW